MKFHVANHFGTSIPITLCLYMRCVDLLLKVQFLNLIDVTVSMMFHYSGGWIQFSARSCITNSFLGQMFAFFFSRQIIRFKWMILDHIICFVDYKYKIYTIHSLAIKDLYERNKYKKKRKKRNIKKKNKRKK